MKKRVEKNFLKTILTILLPVFFSVLFFPGVMVSAEGELEEETVHIDELLDGSSGGLLTENDISVVDTDKLLSVDIKQVFSWIWKKVCEEVTAPITLLITLLSVIVFSSLTQNMYLSGGTDSCGKAGELISVLVCIAVLSEPVGESFLNAVSIVSDGGTFMLAYVPVMAGVMTAQGNVASAGSYQLILLTFCELSVQLSSSVLMPCLATCFSVSIVDAINPGISLGGLINGIKKMVTMLLGLVMTVFTGMLALQSTIGSAADTLSVKTGKYLVSNLVPVVGKAVSDAYSTVYGSLGVLKTGIGAVGITALLMMILPPLIKLFLCRWVIGAAAIASDIFSCPRLKKLFSDMETVFGIAESIVLVFIIMMLISTVIVMKCGGGV